MRHPTIIPTPRRIKTPATAATPKKGLEAGDVIITDHDLTTVNGAIMGNHAIRADDFFLFNFTKNKNSF